MDKIYSRSRIKIPNINLVKLKKVPEKKKRLMIAIIIVAIAIMTCNIILKSFSPIYEAVCRDKARSIATIISNQEATKVMKDYTYEDIVTIYKDKNDNITMIKSNIIPINKIISDVGEYTQKRIDEEGEKQVGINLGSFFGSRILSGRGPKVPLKLSVVGNVKTNLISEFKEAGINQTLHRIYLQVDCTISILTPFDNMQESIGNQVLLAENVIVGLIPDSYYNLEGIEKSNAIDVIE